MEIDWDNFSTYILTTALTYKKSLILWFMLDLWPLNYLCANMSPNLFLQKCKQQHLDKLKEVTSPWVLVGASNSGHSVIAYWLRQLAKSNILWFVHGLWPLNILAPTWAQIYLFFQKCKERYWDKLNEVKTPRYLLAQRAINTLKVHIILHEPLSGLIFTVHGLL